MDPDFLREIGVLRAGFKPLEHCVAPRRAPAGRVDIVTGRIPFVSAGRILVATRATLGCAWGYWGGAQALIRSLPCRR
jgi:hypothetical protein